MNASVSLGNLPFVFSSYRPQYASIILTKGDGETLSGVISDKDHTMFAK